MNSALFTKFNSVALLLVCALFVTSCGGDDPKIEEVTPIASKSIKLENIQDSIAAPASRSLIEARLNVRNTSTVSKSIKVKRYEISVIEGTDNSICWGTQCYPPNITVTPEYQIIVPTGVDTTFKADYIPYGITGVSKYMYVFFDKDSPNDSSYVVITFNGQ
jgi:hypothetical protein